MRHLRSKHHIPTVGPEGLSDVVGRVVGGQEDDRRRDLVHLAEAPDRERGLACLLQLLALCGHDPGRYRAGGYGVDQDAPRGDLARERFGEGYDASLARAVVGEQRSTGLTDLGCDVDDPTSTPLEHVRQDETTAQKRAAQVHTEHPVPLLDRHLLERSLTEDARVVDQNVDPPESLLNRIDHAPYLVFPCDVRAYEDPTPTLALHLSQYGRGRLFGEQVGHGHISALGGARDDVLGGSCTHPTDAEDRRVHRVQPAADERLERDDGVREGEYGVVRTVGVGPVAAGSLDDYAQVVRGSVYRASLDADRAPRDVRVDVRRHDRARSLRQSPFPHDKVRPRRVSLFARLKEGGEGLR